MPLLESLHKLGLEPSAQDVDRWFRKEAGMKQMIVGRSFNGKPLKAYKLIFPADDDKIQAKNTTSTTTTSSEIKPLKKSLQTTVLFLSLVHGNEPLGLLTHLHAARRIVDELPAWIQKHQQRTSYPRIQIIFFPIVNPDAYQANRQHGSGCRRTNLNPVSCSALTAGDSSVSTEPEVATCPYIPNAGVDLNRNFPMDWNSTYTPYDDSPCDRLLKGPHPFSEPETRAIRRIALDPNQTVSAAMSFHSRSGRSKDQALLIHPYASLRPISMMEKYDYHRFRQWSELMNPRELYVTGTAIESIGYAAGGATIDWLFSQFKSMAFVHESTTPCGQRWCPTSYQHSIASQAHNFALAGLRLVQLSLDVPRVERESRSFDDGRLFPSSSFSSNNANQQQTLSIFLYSFSALTILVVWNFRRSRLARFHGIGRLSPAAAASPQRMVRQEHEGDV